eukprot:gene3677-7318_t
MNYNWAKHGALDKLEQFLESQTDISQIINEVDAQDGYTPLMWAAKYGHLHVVKYLLTIKQINIHAVGGWNLSTALMKAAEAGHADIVRILGELGKAKLINEINSSSSTALMRAAEKGHIKVVEQLIYLGASMDLQNNLLYTALILAAENGHIDVLRFLCENYANNSLKNKDGNTALTLSFAKESSPDISSDSSREILKVLLAYNASISVCDKENRTPLTIAAISGRLDIVRELMIHPPTKIHCSDKYEKSEARVAAAEFGHIEVHGVNTRQALARFYIQNEKRFELFIKCTFGKDDHSKERHHWYFIELIPWNRLDFIGLVLLATWSILLAINRHHETALLEHLKYPFSTDDPSETATSYHPDSKALIAVSAIPICIGLMRYLSFHRSLGKQVVMVFKMAMDLSVFGIIIGVSILGFAIAFHGLFGDMQLSNSNSTYSFETVAQTSRVLFDAFLGQHDMTMFDDTPYKYTGIVLLYVYIVMTMVIMLNLIIARFTATHDEINSISHNIWSLMKARNVQEFLLIKERSPLSMLPPPLNIITTTLAPLHYAVLYYSKKYIIVNKMNNSVICTESQRVYDKGTKPTWEVISLCGTVSDWITR